MAGRRKEKQNARLTTSFAIIVATVRPQWFIMENVIQSEKSEAWAEARAMLKQSGYGISESKINAAHFGVPQARRRLFVIGRLGERDGFLQSAIAGAASPQPMTLRDLFDQPSLRTPSLKSDDICAARSELTAKSSSPSGSPETALIQHPEDVALVENGFVYCRPLRAGRGVRTIDEPISTITRTSWERLTSRYLSSPHQDDPIPASEAVMLTRHQISRVQGFPPEWQWTSGTKQDVYQMIANAVPAPVAKEIGKVILTRQSGETAPKVEGQFLDWLVSSGRTRATARNIKANVNRARKLLGGRTFSVEALEIAALEAASGFDALPRATRSDLRKALSLYSEFLVFRRARKRRPEKAEPTVGLFTRSELADAA